MSDASPPTDRYDILAEKFVAVVRAALVRHFVTGGGSVAALTAEIANLLRTHDYAADQPTRRNLGWPSENVRSHSTSSSR